MVEEITRKAIETHVTILRSQGLLDAVISEELDRLTVESGRLSNWTDATHHLPAANYQRLRGAGPISKVLRTFAYLLERLGDISPDLVDRGVCITRIHIDDVHSGCSHYAGRIVVEAREREGAEIVLFEGPFLWDCAVHQIPQSLAAQTLGYRCMVSFAEMLERTGLEVS